MNVSAADVDATGRDVTGREGSDDQDDQGGASKVVNPLTQGPTPRSPEARTTVLRLTSAMLRPALAATAAVGAIAVLVAWLLTGGKGALGGLLGILLVVVSGWFTLALMRWTASAEPVLVMAAALGGYCAKFAAMLTLLIVLGDTTLFDVQTFALALLAGSAVWTLAELVGFVRTRVFTVTPVSDGAD